jgi:hypothetical protein
MEAECLWTGLATADDNLRESGKQSNGLARLPIPPRASACPAMTARGLTD